MNKIHYHLSVFCQFSPVRLFKKIEIPLIFFSSLLYYLSDKYCFFLLLSALLCNGKFHKHLQEIFVPLVVRYVDLMESAIAQSIHRGFEQETWQPVK